MHTQIHSRMLTCTHVCLHTHACTRAQPRTCTAGPLWFTPWGFSSQARHRADSTQRHVYCFKRVIKCPERKDCSVSRLNVPSLTHHSQKWLYVNRISTHFLKCILMTFGLFTVILIKGARPFLIMMCVFLPALSRLIISESIPVLLSTLPRVALAL